MMYERYVFMRVIARERMKAFEDEARRHRILKEANVRRIERFRIESKRASGVLLLGLKLWFRA